MGRLCARALLAAVTALCPAVASAETGLGRFVPTITAAPIVSSVTARAPMPTDDSQHGYAVGNLWNVPGLGMWICQDASVGVAVWEPVQTGILPLDSVTRVQMHGWATRKLRKAFAGSPLAISGTAIAFDASGNVDVSLIAAKLGSPPPISTTSSPQMWSGAVTTEYDQTAGVAMDMTVPTGAIAPQISPLYTTGGSPYVGYAGGGMNWLTDYTGTTNIQIPRLATAVSSGSACNAASMMIMTVLRNGAMGNSVDSAFGCGSTTYPIALQTQNILVTAPLFGTASILAGSQFNLDMAIPSTPSVFGMNGTANTVTAFDDDNATFANAPNTGTGTETSGSVNISSYAALTGGASMQVGDLAVGANIPAGTTVAAVSGDLKTVALSAAPTASASNVPLSFQRGMIGFSTNGALIQGGQDTTTPGFAVGMSAAIYGPSLTAAEQLALRESLTDTFRLTPQVRDQVIMMGASTDAGADGWMTHAPIRFAESVQTRPLTIYNMAIAGTQTGGGASNSANALFSSMAAQQYRSYALNILVLGNGSGVNSLGAGQTPAQTIADWKAWMAKARALGSNVRLVGYTLMPHGGIPTDAIRLSYNALVKANSNTVDALCDLAASPLLGNPAILNDRTYTVTGGGHHSPYYQSMEGLRLGAAIAAAAAK
jgi:hypothetical protein